MNLVIKLTQENETTAQPLPLSLTVVHLTQGILTISLLVCLPKWNKAESLSVCPQTH
jgi:hypothetical protein